MGMSQQNSPEKVLVQNQTALSSQPQAIELTVMFDHDLLLPLRQLFKTDFTRALSWLGCRRFAV
jgi:hypothetical protein